MPRPRSTAPAYRKNSRGYAVVTVRLASGGRRDLTLGMHNSPESLQRYAEVVKQLQANGGCYPDLEGCLTDPDAISVNEILLAYWRYRERRFGADDANGGKYKGIIKRLRETVGTLPAVKFGPRALKLFRDGLVAADYARSHINEMVNRVRSIFYWAVAEELIPGTVAEALRCVRGLQPNDKTTREAPARKPAFWDDLAKVLPFCPPPVAAMLQVMWLTGCRPGEVRIMRTLDLNRTDPLCWVFRPGSDAGPFGLHKCAWRGQTRDIPLGPQGIEIVRPWLREDDPGAYLFRPCDSEEKRNARKREGRKSPGKRRKRKADRGRPWGECYRTDSFGRAVARACKKAGVEFAPYDLRHGRKMDVERNHGLDAARCLLGQKSVESTQHYGERDLERARELARKEG